MRRKKYRKVIGTTLSLVMLMASSVIFSSSTKVVAANSVVNAPLDYDRFVTIEDAKKNNLFTLYKENPQDTRKAKKMWVCGVSFYIAGFNQDGSMAVVLDPNYTELHDIYGEKYIFSDAKAGKKVTRTDDLAYAYPQGAENLYVGQNHYYFSNIRNEFAIDKYFFEKKVSDYVKKLFKPTIIQTEDSYNKNNNYCILEEKIFAPYADSELSYAIVGNNGFLEGGPKVGIDSAHAPEGSPFDKVSFWLRKPYFDSEHNKVYCVKRGKIEPAVVTDKYSSVGAANLDMSNVLFLTAGASGYIYEPVFDGKDKIPWNISVSCDGIIDLRDIPHNRDDIQIVIQGMDGTKPFEYRKEIWMLNYELSAKSVLSEGTDFENCRVWIDMWDSANEVSYGKEATYQKHDFSEMVMRPTGDGSHGLGCSNCNKIHPDSTLSKCQGGRTTCWLRAKCEVCKGRYGPEPTHRYSNTWERSATNHWLTCTECVEVSNNEVHRDMNNDCKCDVCGFVIHKQAIKRVPQVNPTCKSYGVKAYYKCGCGKCYADEGGTKEITNLAIWKTTVGRIEKTAHTYSTTWKSNDKNHWHACTVCGATKDGTAHKLETTYTKATKTTDGKKVTKCSVCGKVTANVPIYAAKTVKLSSTSFTYDGKVKTPTLVVRDSKGNTITEKDYSISYSSGRKNVGTYNVKIVFKRNYTGSKVMSFSVLPQKTEIKSIAARTKAFNVKWDAMTKQTSGYQIQYSTSNKFASDNKLVNITSNTTVSKTIKNLKANQKYYVRVRTYKTVNNKNYYSHWSAIKSVTTK